MIINKLYYFNDVLFIFKCINTGLSYVYKNTFELPLLSFDSSYYALVVSEKASKKINFT